MSLKRKTILVLLLLTGNSFAINDINSSLMNLRDRLEDLQTMLYNKQVEIPFRAVIHPVHQKKGEERRQGNIQNLCPQNSDDAFVIDQLKTLTPHWIALLKTIMELDNDLNSLHEFIKNNKGKIFTKEFDILKIMQETVKARFLPQVTILSKALKKLRKVNVNNISDQTRGKAFQYMNSISEKLAEFYFRIHEFKKNFKNMNKTENFFLGWLSPIEEDYVSAYKWFALYIFYPIKVQTIPQENDEAAHECSSKQLNCYIVDDLKNHFAKRQPVKRPAKRRGASSAKGKENN